MNQKFTLFFIIILTLVCIYVDLPKLPYNFSIFKTTSNNLLDKFPLRLGLDLQGGSELTLQADMSKIGTSDKDTALESARTIIENRVNLFGVSEALVQSSKVGADRRILVELPGLKNASEAASLVGRTAQLEFKEMVGSPSAVIRTQADLFANFKSTGLTGADLKKAAVVFGSGAKSTSGPEVSLQFTDKGATKFSEITARNVGKPLGIFLDNQPVSWPPPVVQTRIDGGNAVITGKFTTDEAKNLAIQLNAGALPVPIRILQQRTIGPSLGQESIDKSLLAGVIGLTVVMMYMWLYYGVLGLIADLGLLIYTIITLAIFKTGLFIFPPITLTLAGIAGFILSIGMAVDANILIFERMNEELRWGKTRARALQLGFERAWSSILASNVSSLITAIILFEFGTSLVRGFALTLAIGVLLSMFTAVFVTRTLLRVLLPFFDTKS